MKLPNIDSSKTNDDLVQPQGKRGRHTSTPSPVSAMYEPPASMRSDAGQAEGAKDSSGFDVQVAPTAAGATAATGATAAAGATAVAGAAVAGAAAGQRTVSASAASASAAREAANARRKRDRELPPSQRTFYITVSAVAIVALLWVAVQVMNILATPVSILIWTALFVFILRPIVNGLEKRGIKRGLGTAIAFVAMFVVLGLILFLMISPAVGLGDQMMNLAQSIPSWVAGITDWMNGIYAQYADILSNESLHKFFTDALSQAAEALRSVITGGASGIMNLGTGIANTLVGIGFGLVIAFWLLMELPALGREVKRLIDPERAEDFHMTKVTITRIMGGYIFATLIQCAIIAVACCVLFTLDGSPTPLALGVICGILNLIPVVGAWFGGILAALAGIIVGPITAIISLVGAVLIHWLVYTFVSPRLMETSVDIHPALTLFSLTLGSAVGSAISGLGGALVGALISIPLAAVIKTEFAYYFEKRTGRHLIAEDGVFFQGTVHEEDDVDPLADATSSMAATSGSLSLTGRFSKVNPDK